VAEIAGQWRPELALSLAVGVVWVIRTEGLAEEDSLADNVQRAPLDPFRALQATNAGSSHVLQSIMLLPIAEAASVWPNLTIRVRREGFRS